METRKTGRKGRVERFGVEEGLWQSFRIPEGEKGEKRLLTDLTLFP